MILKDLEVDLSIIQIAQLEKINFSITPLFIANTTEELSVVLPTESVPTETISREDNWQGFKIEGVLDFSLVGILAKISSLLAENNISIFAISTYNTDYILVKSEVFSKAKDVLASAGYDIK